MRRNAGVDEKRAGERACTLGGLFRSGHVIEQGRIAGRFREKPYVKQPTSRHTTMLGASARSAASGDGEQ